MNTAEVQAGYRPVEESTLKAIAGGAIMESIGAVATIALAIIGLAGVFSTAMAAIATIVLGAAILIEGGAYAASYAEAASRSGGVGRALEWSEGLSAEFLGGLTGIVLGILALLGVAPLALLSVAAIVLGATFLFSSVGSIGYSSRSVMGLAAVVLGLLAVVGHSPAMLVLVALACLGVSALFNGAATSARMTTAARK